MQEAAVDFASDLKKKEKEEDKRVYTGGVRPTSHIGQQKSGATSQQGWKGNGEYFRFPTILKIICCASLAALLQQVL